MKEKLNNWKEVTNDLAIFFAEKYFKDEEDDTPEYWWIADEVGGRFYVNDYDFSVNDMATAIENNATFDQIDEYYDLRLESYENGKTIANFKNFIKYGFTYV